MAELYYNAKVYVEKGHYEQAVLVEDGIIRRIGSSDALLADAPADATRVDCGGRTLIPGLNDSHMHFAQFSETLNQAHIADVKSIAELIEVCRKFAQEHPQRVKNGLHAIGWNQDYFTDGSRLPDRHDLDKISTDYPIVLERVCGHIVSVNSKLLEILQSTGEIDKCKGEDCLTDENGVPNGIFTGNGCNIAKRLIPEFTLEERHEFMKDAMDYAVSHGLTSVQSNDVGTTFLDTPAAFRLLHEMYDNGEGKVRYRHQVCFHDLAAFRESLLHGEYSRRSQYDGFLTLGPLKLFQDGSLGARTAMLRGGYPGEPDNHGLAWTTREDMAAFCGLASEHGIQVVTHAIGDEAISRVLDAYEAVIPAGQRNPLRHALIHCQITDRALCRRIAELGVLVMAQPVFLDADRELAEKLCGRALAETSYAFGSLLRAGVHLSYGTDCPVESCAPLWNLGAAVTRCDANGTPAGGFVPSERVDVETAVDAYTMESAYAEFQEHCKGRLKPGYYADLTVLDQDIFTMDPMKIRSVSPVLTMTGGRIVFERTN